MRRRVKRLLAAVGLAALVAGVARWHRQRRDPSGRLWWEAGAGSADRRSGTDRRSGADRRTAVDGAPAEERRSGHERRAVVDRRSS
jgi:hypothetical protein